MSNNRKGFTLVELLVVILVIAILASIIVPTAMSAVRQARIASAKSEIASIETAIADFESEFGKTPPSSLSFTTRTLPSGRVILHQPTMAVLRSMFPEAELNVDPSYGDTPIIADIQAMGLWETTLSGSESLVLLLGGIKTNGRFYGFSQNPRRPFAQPATSGTTRKGPFFDFDLDRIVETDDYLGYLDSLPGQSKPILFASNSLTSSYLSDDVPELDDGPYKKSANEFANPTTYQIISPGYDSDYGSGGENRDGADSDNLTNFSEGELGG